jgi:hypothetical protein
MPFILYGMFKVWTVPNPPLTDVDSSLWDYRYKLRCDPPVLHGQIWSTNILPYVTSVQTFQDADHIVIGFPSLAVILLAEAVLQWKYLGTDSKAGNAACLFFIFLYIVFFQFIDTASFVWAAEVFPTTIRAKGLGLSMFAYFVGAITYTTPAALAFKNM